MTYSVWIGGCEEHTQCTYSQAIRLKSEYLAEGYDDVEIEEIQSKEGALYVEN